MWPRGCGRGIALLFHDRGTRRGWVVSSTPRPHFTSGKDPVPILQEAGWAPGPVWTGGKSRPHRDSISDRPARSSVTILTELPGPPVTWKYLANIYCKTLLLHPSGVCLIREYNYAFPNNLTYNSYGVCTVHTHMHIHVHVCITGRGRDDCRHTISVELSRWASKASSDLLWVAELVEFISWYYPFEKHRTVSCLRPLNLNIFVEMLIYIYIYICNVFIFQVRFCVMYV